MKVKISKSKKFTVPSEPTTFDISLRDEKEEVKGTLTIDTIKKTMRVDLGKPLTDYTNDKRRTKSSTGIIKHYGATYVFFSCWAELN